MQETSTSTPAPFWPDLSAIRTTLMNDYEKLDPSSRLLVDLLAVCGTEIYRDEIKPLFKIANMTHIETKRKNLASLGLIDDSDWSMRINKCIQELCVRRVVSNGSFLRCVKMIAEFRPSFDMKSQYGYNSYQYGWRSDSGNRISRLRNLLYAGDIAGFVTTLQSSPVQNELLSQISADVFANPFDPLLLKGFSVDIRDSILTYILYHTVKAVESLDALDKYVKSFLQRGNASAQLKEISGVITLLQGDMDGFRDLFAGENKISLSLQCMHLAMTGQYDEAVLVYEPALRTMRKDRTQRILYIEHPAFQFYLLSLLRENTAQSRAATVRVLKMTDGYDSLVFKEVFTTIENMIVMFETTYTQHQFHSFIENSRSRQPWVLLFTGMAHFWMSLKNKANDELPLQSLLARAESSGYMWLASQIAAILQKKTGETKYGTIAETFCATTGCVSLCSMFSVKTQWQLTLEKISGIAPPVELNQTGAGTGRIVWLIYKNDYSYSDSEMLYIFPSFQKVLKKGTWSRPYAIAKSGFEAALAITEEKEKILMEKYGAMLSRSSSYPAVFSDLEILRFFVGHPRLYLKNEPDVRVDLVLDEPRITVKKSKIGYQVELNPIITTKGAYLVVEESASRFRIVPVSDRHRRLYEILGVEGIQIPSEGKEQLVKTLESIGAITPVESDALEITGQQITTVDSDKRIWVIISPASTGLSFEFAVRPIPDGRTYPPGHGGNTAYETIKGIRYMAERTLKSEIDLANEVVVKCANIAEWGSENEWRFGVEDPTDCLDALSELRALGERVELLWPQGEKYAVSRPLSSTSMRLNINKNNDWFDIDGELAIDENRTIAMRLLLDLLDTTPQRFIKIEEGQFIALTEELRRRLDDIRAFTQTHGKSLRLHPLAAAAIGGLDEESSGVSCDAHWLAVIKKMRAVESVESSIPSTFAGDLRDYQREGFRWMKQLSHIGAGACLADDMGLGKTIQTLAFLLDRASEGPALIVAPLSVCGNWIVEAQRFAPSLNIHQFGLGDRSDMVQKAGPFDLVTCSYGLLQQESELLASKSWHTVVLDEAQAIKNSTAKRTKAAMDLPAHMRLVTTGTPVENRLSEIWTIFQFINPGLLGSLESFNRRFALPIEQRRDADARHRLKRIISPFILRRTKIEVLDELPPKTTIVVNVEMSVEETAFYEAIRRKAIDTLADTADDPGRNHLRILAEITRMRRACCHSSLVAPDMAISSSKLTAFGERVEELIANNHRALVFSQFVDYLSIVRKFLDDQKISYQYLDGSTPQRDRQRAVSDFQAGKGELFLISLRAGGFGLNLTGADYVLHMDPWWNPAVEDQASDRVHRIGQTRPVTIYRFVTTGTIEEKILKLHAEKRDLAQSLLDGSEVAGKIDAEELLRLIRDE